MNIGKRTERENNIVLIECAAYISLCGETVCVCSVCESAHFAAVLHLINICLYAALESGNSLTIQYELYGINIVKTRGSYAVCHNDIGISVSDGSYFFIVYRNLQIFNTVCDKSEHKFICIVEIESTALELCCFKGVLCMIFAVGLQRVKGCSREIVVDNKLAGSVAHILLRFSAVNKQVFYEIYEVSVCRAFDKLHAVILDSHILCLGIGCTVNYELCREDITHALRIDAGEAEKPHIGYRTALGVLELCSLYFGFSCIDSGKGKPDAHVFRIAVGIGPHERIGNANLVVHGYIRSEGYRARDKVALCRTLALSVKHSHRNDTRGEYEKECDKRRKHISEKLFHKFLPPNIDEYTNICMISQNQHKINTNFR